MLQKRFIEGVDADQKEALRRLRVTAVGAEACTQLPIMPLSLTFKLTAINFWERSRSADFAMLTSWCDAAVQEWRQKRNINNILTAPQPVFSYAKS